MPAEHKNHETSMRLSRDMQICDWSNQKRTEIGLWTTHTTQRRIGRALTGIFQWAREITWNRPIENICIFCRFRPQDSGDASFIRRIKCSGAWSWNYDYNFSELNDACYIFFFFHMHIRYINYLDFFINF